ncbi:hypothetical protein N0V85_004193 [Neurospora sp. IMI 360204]|nr:hypothetical protein N0V85_004193 [Neurospora sp. IMI 360204]
MSHRLLLIKTAGTPAEPAPDEPAADEPAADEPAAAEAPVDDPADGFASDHEADPASEPVADEPKRGKDGSGIRRNRGTFPRAVYVTSPYPPIKASSVIS